jgi:trk system potassium uptake protein TrkH
MVKRQGRRLGDVRVRVERVKPQAYDVRPDSRIRRPPPPAALVLVTGFALMILAGTLLLMLPISSATGDWTRPLDALFTATSAVCVTGLVVVDTATYWSPFGQVVLLVLIQAGGFGFMTGSTLLLFVLVGRRTGLRDRILAQESTGVRDLGSVTTVLKRVALFTIIAEGIGTLVLSVAFLARYGEAGTAVWHGLFHAISAFNNAGFDLMGEFRSLTGFANDPFVLAPIGLLILVGGLGYAIVGDALVKRRWSRFALETKLVLLTTAFLLVGGTLAIATFEWSNPATLGAMPESQRVLNAAFEATSLRTAGFSALPTGELAVASLFVVMALMFIGGASGSTAGGIKVNTFSILLFTIISTARGRPSAEAFGRRVPHLLIYRALSVALLSVAAVFVFALGLQLLSAESFVNVLFEAVSALGTVGASTGITVSLPDAARAWLIPAMYIGRLGPLTLVLALAARTKPVRVRPAVETIRIG